MLPRGLVALEVLAVGPAILQVAVKVAPILIAVARIAPKISGVNAPILGEVATSVAQTWEVGYAKEFCRAGGWVKLVW